MACLRGGEGPAGTGAGAAAAAGAGVVGVGQNLRSIKALEILKGLFTKMLLCGQLKGRGQHLD